MVRMLCNLSASFMYKTRTSSASPTNILRRYITEDSLLSGNSNLFILDTELTIIATSSPKSSFKSSYVLFPLLITSCNKEAIIVVSSTFKSSSILVTSKGCVIKSSPVSLFIPLCSFKAYSYALFISS